MIKKALKVWAMMVALSIPFVASAQGGLFQRGEESIHNEGLLRSGGGAINVTNQTFGHPTDGVNVTNQTFGAPLGSGIFTMLLASAGYAVLKSNRRKVKREHKMKKINIILMAFALAITMSQCKKSEEQPTANDNVVTITLNLSNNNGSKVNVNPATGTVDFESGDKIYVGSGGKYVGFLTHNGTNFSGNITNPTENQPLQLYFLGNVTPQETLSAGTTEECSVIISDQTEHLPVISCAASNENYVSGITAYSAHLLNKCALVKFNVTTPSNAAICITGMKNKVTVDFSQNMVTPSMDGEGIIKLPAGAGENVEKWALLLPQDALVEGEEGTAYTENGAYSGTRGAVPTIDENGYYDTGIEVNVMSIAPIDHEYVDLGLPSGTLWATCNVGANAPEEYGDYFAWGETQTKENYDWSTYQYCNGSYNTLTKYCTDSDLGYNGFIDDQTTLLPEDDAAAANWGNSWRMPTKAEWQELYNNTTVTWTTQNGISGRLFTANNGNSIFLPASGYRNGSSLGHAGSYGSYLSSSLDMDNPYLAWILGFHSDYHYMPSDYRYFGQSVRPVRSSGQNNAPTGAINGLFTINANGDQAYFSQGNLQYQASTNTWRFASNQFEYVGASNSNISPTYDGWIDLFGWGTRNNPTQTSTNNSDYPSFQEWGVVRISNGGNTYNQWRTLSNDEWLYVLNTRQTASGIRYVKARVNFVKGVILLPDNWNPTYYTLNNINQNNVDFSSNVINDIAQWNNIEQHGAVFLPAAGTRDGTTVYNLDYAGNYWSSSIYQYYNYNDYAYHMSFSSSSLGTYNNYRYRGFSVRLVQDYNQ